MAGLDPNRRRFLAWASVAMVLVQTAASIRYINRLPDDWLGIGIYLITILAFAGLSLVFFMPPDDNSR